MLYLRSIVAGFLIGLPALCYGGWLSDEFAPIYQFEAQGKWQQAYEAASAKGNGNALLKSHAETINRTLSGFAAVDNFRDAGQLDDAIQITSGLLAELTKDRTTNQHLIIATEKLASDLEQARQNASQKKAKDIAGKGYALLNAGDFEGALKLFDVANALMSGVVSAERRGQAEKGKLRNAALVQQASQPTVWDKIAATLGQAAATLSEWFIYFAVAIGVYSAGRWFRSKRRKGTGIMLEDQCVGTDQRESKSQELSQEMARVIMNLVTGSMATPASGELMDLDATNLPNARDPLGGIAAIASHIDASAGPVRIGPLEFRPKQLFAYLSLLTKRPYEYTFGGILKKNTTHLSLHVTKFSHDGSVVEGGLFEASRAFDDPQCRDSVIKDVATQIAVSLPGSKVTDNWRSLRSYLQAESLLALEAHGDDRKDRYEQAKHWLQQALAHDPANWMARFKLASVLRILGDNEAARDQFDYVERMLGSQEILRFHHFGEFLKHSPEFPWILRYNLIASMSKLAGQKSVGRAQILIDQLVAELDAAESIPSQPSAEQASSGEPPGDLVIGELGRRWRDIRGKLQELKITLSSECRNNLLLLARGGRAAVLGSEIERLREVSASFPGNARALHQRMSDLLSRICEDEQWLRQMTPHVKSDSWPTFAQAHAAAQNAYGRACYVMGRFDDAIKYLRWAIQMHVPQNLPDPHINLAAVYVKRRDRFSPDWAEKAKRHLETALVISPYNQKAHYLLGKVYATAGIADYDKALDEFRKAGDTDSSSLYQRGMLQLQQKRDVVAAVDLLRRSVALAERADFRHKQYLYAVLALTENREIDKIYFDKQLAHAIRVASILEKRGVTNKLKEIGAVMKMRFELLQTARGGEPAEKQDAA